MMSGCNKTVIFMKKILFTPNLYLHHHILHIILDYPITVFIYKQLLVKYMPSHLKKIMFKMKILHSVRVIQLMKVKYKSPNK